MGSATYSSMIVGRNTGIEAKETLEREKINAVIQFPASANAFQTSPHLNP
jgi:hypothetical protein